MAKKVNNASYVSTVDIGASKIKQIAWYYVNVLLFMNPLNPFSSLKVFVLRLFGARIGRDVNIKPSVNIKFPWKLTIGDRAWIGEDTWIDNLSPVHIGSSVTLSQGALLLTGSHNAMKTTFDFVSGEIILEDGVWIGARAVVTGGVTCKTHSILGTNGVAESNLNAYTIYKGNPAVPVIERIIH